MIEVFLGCLSWIVFYASVKSHFRHETGLDDWEYYIDEGVGCLTYTYRRQDGSIGSHDDQSETADENDSSDSHDENDDKSEGIDDAIASYVIPEELELEKEAKAAAEEEKEKEKEQEKKQEDVKDEEEEERNAGDDSIEENALEEEHLAGPILLLDTWKCTPHAGIDQFIEELCCDLSEEECAQVQNTITQAQNILEQDWITLSKTILRCDAFDLSTYSERVRARLMAPAVWSNYCDGSREICEYLFAKSLIRWMTEKDA